MKEKTDFFAKALRDAIAIITDESASLRARERALALAASIAEGAESPGVSGDLLATAEVAIAAKSPLAAPLASLVASLVREPTRTARLGRLVDQAVAAGAWDAWLALMLELLADASVQLRDGWVARPVGDAVATTRAEAARQLAEALAVQGDPRTSGAKEPAMDGPTTHPVVPQPRRLLSVMKTTFKQMQVTANAGNRVPLPTRIPEYDDLTGGLREGELTLLVPRSPMAGLHFALELVANGPPETDLTCIRMPITLLFTLQRSGEQLAEFWTARRSRVDLRGLRAGTLLASDWSRLAKEAPALAELPLWIDDTTTGPVSELKDRVLRARPARQPDAQVVIVDGIEQLGPDGCRELKSLARELRLPVIAVASAPDAWHALEPDIVSSVLLEADGTFDVAVRLRDAGTTENFTFRPGHTPTPPAAASTPPESS